MRTKLLVLCSKKNGRSIKNLINAFFLIFFKKIILVKFLYQIFRFFCIKKEIYKFISLWPLLLFHPWLDPTSSFIICVSPVCLNWIPQPSLHFSPIFSQLWISWPQKTAKTSKTTQMWVWMSECRKRQKKEDGGDFWQYFNIHPLYILSTIISDLADNKSEIFIF